MNYVIFNGKLTEECDVYISPNDRGFRYGDGVFETVLIHGGRPYNWDFHWKRLSEGLAAVRMNLDISVLPSLCSELLLANNFNAGLLRIQITRGVGGRGYLPERTIPPTLLIETMVLPAPPNAITLWLSNYAKISPKALPVNYKICQGMNSTLARIEAAENNCFDGLMLNEAGQICETSSANIFWLKDGVLYTPTLSCGVLDGSIRNVIIRLSPYPIQEIAAGVEELRNAESVFITNTAHKIVSIRELKPLGISFNSNDLAKQMLHLLDTDIARKTLN